MRDEAEATIPDLGHVCWEIWCVVIWLRVYGWTICAEHKKWGHSTRQRMVRGAQSAAAQVYGKQGRSPRLWAGTGGAKPSRPLGWLCVRCTRTAYTYVGCRRACSGPTIVLGEHGLPALTRQCDTSTARASSNCMWLRKPAGREIYSGRQAN